MKTLFLLIALQVSQALSAGPPNVILIYADDLGYGDLVTAYNLANDPAATQNLARTEPAKLKELVATLDQITTNDAKN